MSITVMKQALYALEMGLVETFHARQENAITALRAAIAEAENQDRHQFWQKCGVSNQTLNGQNGPSGGPRGARHER